MDDPCAEIIAFRQKKLLINANVETARLRRKSGRLKEKIVLSTLARSWPEICGPLTAVQRRRRWLVSQKEQIVAAAIGRGSRLPRRSAMEPGFTQSRLNSTASGLQILSISARARRPKPSAILSPPRADETRIHEPRPHRH